MSDRVKRFMRQPIDFRPTRGHIDSSLIYTVLVHYNGSKNSQHSASGLILDAYRKYDPSESVEVTKMNDFATRALAFMDLYNVRNEADIVNAVKNETVKINTELIEPAEKNFSFDMNDPDVVDMWDKLNAVRYRDRGTLVNRFLYQYMANGHADYYKDLCAARLLLWFKDEYTAGRQLQNESFSRMARLLYYANAIREAQEENVSSDELRRFAGVTIRDR